MALVLLTTLIAVGGSVAYVAKAAHVYKAQADILVVPVSSSDYDLIGLALLTNGGDPSRPIETAAYLVTASPVIERVQRALRLHLSIQEIQNKLSVVPVAQSDLVVVSASASTAGAAQRLANAAVTAFIADRNEALRQNVRLTLANLQDAVGSAARRSELLSLAAAGDPTVHAVGSATRPQSAASPRPFVTVVGAAVAGFIIGIALLFVLQAARAASDAEYR